MSKNKIKIFESFSGYGSQFQALKNLYGDRVESVGISEWQTFPIVAYANIHFRDEFINKQNEIKEMGLSKEQLIEMLVNYSTFSTETKKVKGQYEVLDEKKYKRWNENKLIEFLAALIVSDNKGSITDIKGNEMPETDIFTYSFPCQDISLAGKQKGLSCISDDGSVCSTRSGLLYEVERLLIEGYRPKILMMENVKNLVGKKFKDDFDKWILKLEDLGYKTTWKVLNTKYTVSPVTGHTIPQNRERVFAISSLDHEFIDNFVWPDQVDTTNKLKDFLETDVDEDYYLSNEHIAKILGWKAFEKPLTKVLHQDSNDVGSITTRSGDDTSSQKLVMDDVTAETNHINVEKVIKDDATMDTIEALTKIKLEIGNGVVSRMGGSKSEISNDEIPTITTRGDRTRTVEIEGGGVNSGGDNQREAHRLRNKSALKDIQVWQYNTRWGLYYLYN